MKSRTRLERELYEALTDKVHCYGEGEQAICRLQWITDVLRDYGVIEIDSETGEVIKDKTNNKGE